MQTFDDVRFAVRLFSRQRTFTITAVLSLSLAAAAATAGYAVAHALLWKPLPYREPGRLVVVWETHAKTGFTNRNEVAFANFLDWRDRNGVFEHLTALAYRSVNLTGTGEPERLQAAAPSVDFFDMLGVRPALGRTFRRDEESPAAEPVAILSHAAWARRFGSNPSIVGSRIALNGISTTVVGVLPQSFAFEFPTSRSIDVWVPRVVTPQARQARRSRALYVVGRLKPDVSIAQARSEMVRIAAHLADEHPAQNREWSAMVVPLQQQIGGAGRSRVLLVFGAGLCVLLIACANVAALQIANVTARRSELAIRAAIGAGERRILRQFVTESLVLAGASTAAGIAIAWWFLRAIASGWIAIDLPRIGSVGLDAAVVAFAAAVAVSAALIIGLVPAHRVAAGELGVTLRQAPLERTGGSLRQSVIVAAEVALAVVLVIAATLLVRSLARLETVETGFRSEGVLTFELALPANRYSTNEQIANFYAVLMERLQGVAGIESAGAISNLPLGGSSGTVRFVLERQSDATADMEAEYRAVTPGYFATLSIPLRSGRLFTASDAAQAPFVAVVNQAMARRWWPDRDPIGSRLRFSAQGPWVTIVGIVGDVRHSALEAAPLAELYLPQSQWPNDYMHVVVRAAVPPETVARAATAQVHALDPQLPAYGVRSMAAIVDRALARPRATTTVVTLFGSIAALLAIGGAYAVVAYVTGRRRREVGVRLALGATRRQIVQVLLRDGAAAAVLGVGVGAVASAGLTRLMASTLFGISPTDPLTFTIVPAGILLVTAMASAIPAWRASRLDAMSVLKAD